MDQKHLLAENMKFITMLLAVMLLMCFSLSQGLPQFKAEHGKEEIVSDYSHVEDDIIQAHYQVKRHAENVLETDNEAVRFKRDAHNNNGSKICCGNKSANQNCCSPNGNSAVNGNAGNTSVGGTSNCVCNTFPYNNMNNNNNNMGPTVYNNMYYICHCGTNPNPGNVMSCCAPNKINRNCNCCSDCACGCNNGSNVCVCGRSGMTTSSCQSNYGGNICYTFGKTCCNAENIKNSPLNGFANHYGPIFIYNNYYYYCTCLPSNNVRHPSACSTTCTCGCQPNRVQPSMPLETFQSVTHKSAHPTQTIAMTYTYKGKTFSSLDALRKFLETEDIFTTHMPVFTHPSIHTRHGVRFNLFDSNNLGARYGDTQPRPHPHIHPHPAQPQHHHHHHHHHHHSAKSNPYVYTYAFGRGHTDAPIYPKYTQHTQIPTTPSTTNQANKRHNNQNRFGGGSGLSGIDLSELFRHL